MMNKYFVFAIWLWKGVGFILREPYMKLKKLNITF